MTEPVDRKVLLFTIIMFIKNLVIEIRLFGERGALPSVFGTNKLDLCNKETFQKFF